ncbi:MAG: DUF58 domain-containing protein, partial [Granulosicoccaceae bacterium]
MRPSTRLCTLFVALWFLALAAAWLSVPSVLVWGFAILALGVSAVDAMILWRQHLPVARRQLPQMVPVSQRFFGELNVQFQGKGEIQGELVEQSPEGICCQQSRHQLTLGNDVLRLDIEYLAERRGNVQWQWLQWTAKSALGLWHRRSLIPCASTLAVYPDYASSRRQLNISSARSMRELGVVKRQRAGESQEFHQLRAYQQGDSLRQIDWKATSRKRQLIARQYAEESNQSLVLMLDCGRRMSLQHGQRQLLDEAMDAALMVAEVALRQGDKVAVQCFATEAFYWSGLNRTPQAISAMLSQLYNVHCRAEASDYVDAARVLRATLKQRSTIVMVTHSRNENMEELNTAARILGNKHAFVVADIGDGELYRILRREPQCFDETLTYLGALEYRSRRVEAQRQLRSLGTD